VVRVWSCGCHDIVASQHHSFLIPPELRRRVPFPTSDTTCDNEYFKNFEHVCGPQGDPASHAQPRTTPAFRKPFEQNGPPG